MTFGQRSVSPLSILALISFVELQHLEKHVQQMLLVSTLNGSLYAVDRLNGDIIWTMEEDPVLVMDSESLDHPLFLPNPQDGTLYAFVDGKDILEQLPVSIPKLVKMSPCQTSDGKIYITRKTDQWLAVNRQTGSKLYTLSSDGVDSFCPTEEGEDVMFIGKSTYVINVYDSKTREIIWNATYTQYSSFLKEKGDMYDMIHFCSSSDGSIKTLDSLTGQLLWDRMLGSPVVGLYSWSEGRLHTVPIITVAKTSLKFITGSTALAVRTKSMIIEAQDHLLQFSLFIGTTKFGIYAMPSLVDENSIMSESALPLLPGRPGNGEPGDGEAEVFTSGDPPQSPSSKEVGHIHIPLKSSVQLIHVADKDLNDLEVPRSEASSVMGIEQTHRNPFEKYIHRFIAQSPEQPKKEENMASSPGKAGSESGWVWSAVVSPFLSVLLSSVTATIISTVIIAKYLSKILAPQNAGNVQLDRREESKASQHSQPEGGQSDGVSEEVDRMEKPFLGKISFDSSEVLGRGSEGTIVFKGTFDKRTVAVKRILKECFVLANHEVALLRETDQHSHVIRYFCMEEDESFCYIALEFCQATIHEYVEDWRFDRCQIDEMTLIQQTFNGLAHLHRLGIVHRDIKPRNVLISQKASDGSVRALISDFGFSRKLPQGKGSYTFRSGVTGTEGWIAPEVLKQSSRVTFAIDIFSAGCLLYYVVSGGDHPFGPPFQRQANIEAGNSKLTKLSGRDDPHAYMTADLVNQMIAHQSGWRPSTEEILQHCLFWPKKKQLAFFQDVSDRIEKESSSSIVVQSLERDARQVLRGDWRNNIGEDLRQDLRKFRSYQGTSLRDLLRAMRNKKHHYRELSEQLQTSLGSVPDGFLDYFTSRFPQLLVHTYKSMAVVKHEKIFHTYYSSS